MAGLKFALGMIPNTLKTESADDNLRKEYVDYIEYDKSEELKHFLELETEVLSADFSSRKKEILSLKYKNSNEYKKEKEFLGLEKSKAIKNYFKVKDSQQLKDYNGIKASDTLSKYLDLEKFANSDSLAKAKVDLPPKEFKISEEAAKEKEYLRLKNSSQFKKHFKFENSAPYKESLEHFSDEAAPVEEAAIPEPAPRPAAAPVRTIRVPVTISGDEVGSSVPIEIVLEVRIAEPTT